MSDIIYGPDGTRVVRQTSDGTQVVLGAGECILSGLSCLDREAYDLRRPINASNGVVAVVAVLGLAQQEGYVPGHEHEAALAEQQQAHEAEHADLIEYKVAAEVTIAALGDDLAAAIVDRSNVDRLERELKAAKRVVLESSSLKVELEAALEAVDRANAERDAARRELRQTIAKPSAAPVAAKRPVGRPRKQA